MKCTKCSRTMTQGSPHPDYRCRQWECRCGYIIIERGETVRIVFTKRAIKEGKVKYLKSEEVK